MRKFSTRNASEKRARGGSSNEGHCAGTRVPLCGWVRGHTHAHAHPPRTRRGCSEFRLLLKFLQHDPVLHGRSVKSWRDPSQANRCLGQSNAEKCLFVRPGLSTFWRNDNRTDVGSFGRRTRPKMRSEGDKNWWRKGKKQRTRGGGRLEKGGKSWERGAYAAQRGAKGDEAV